VKPNQMLLIVGGVTIFILIVALIIPAAAIAFLANQKGGTACGEETPAATQAYFGISVARAAGVGNPPPPPKKFWPIYQKAAAASKLGPMGPSILAAVHGVETTYSANVNSSSAGAQGPMQFMPGTWASYGVDGNGDGKKDIMNDTDAIFGAANYLKKSGAPGNWKEALFAYNRAGWYVNGVLDLAKKNNIPATGGGEEASSESCNQNVSDTGTGGASGDTKTLAGEILANKKGNISYLAGSAKGSVDEAAAGKCSKTGDGKCVEIDPRIFQTILDLAEGGPIMVNSLSGGEHATGSSHYFGKAVDFNPGRDQEAARTAKKNGARWSGASCGGMAGLPSVEGGGTHCHLGWGKQGAGP